MNTQKNGNNVYPALGNLNIKKNKSIHSRGIYIYEILTFKNLHSWKMYWLHLHLLKTTSLTYVEK